MQKPTVMELIESSDSDNFEFIGETVSIRIMESPISDGDLMELSDLEIDEFSEKMEVSLLNVKKPKKTFAIRVKGDSMYPTLKDGDMLLVDSSDQARFSNLENKVIVALINSGSTVKRLRIINEKYFLVPDNISFPSIEVDEWMNFQVGGKVLEIMPPHIPVL